MTVEFVHDETAAMAMEAAQTPSTARGRTGATQNMSGKITRPSSAKENWLPAASPTDSPSSKMRRQFQSTTSRGA